jgi:hypothetical protein
MGFAGCVVGGDYHSGRQKRRGCSASTSMDCIVCMYISRGGGAARGGRVVQDGLQSFRPVIIYRLRIIESS